MKNTTETSALSLLANDAGYDPLEDRLRENIRSTIEAVFEEELAQFLGRCRYGREDALRQGYRNGHRERQLTGTFGTERVSVPRARIVECSAPGSLDTSLSHAAGLIEIAACHA